MSSSTTAPTPQSSSWAFLRTQRALSVPLLLIIVLAVFLRAYNLGTESYWQDEIIMIHVTTSGIDEIVNQVSGGRPPLYVVLSAVWSEIWGTSEVATRSLSALLSAGAVIVLYFLANEWFDRRVALIAALLMALSTFQIHHGQNHRYYALMVLVATTSFLFYFRALNSGKWSDFVLWGVFGAATYYTHTHGLFVLLAQGIYFILQWFRYRQVFVRWFVTVISIGIIASPGLYILLRGMLVGAGEEGEIVLSWLNAPSLSAIPLTLARFFFYHINAEQLTTIAIGVGVVMIGTIIYVVSQGLPTWTKSVVTVPRTALKTISEHRPEAVMLACWLVIPIVVPFILSVTVTPMYLDRYLISASPALYMITATILLLLRRVIPLYASLGALVIMLSIALYNFYVDDYKEQWDEATAYIVAESESSDAIAVSHITASSYPGIFDSFDWYYNGELPLCHIIETQLNDPVHIAEVNECLGDIDRLWIPIIVVPNDDTEGRIDLFNDFLSDRDLSVQIERQYEGLYVLIAE